MPPSKTRPRGSMIPRGTDRYLLRVFVGLDPSGKRVYASKTVAMSKKDAAKELARFALEAEAQGGKLAGAESDTVADFSEKWLASKRRLDDGTRFHYRVRIRKTILPYFGTAKLRQITEDRVQWWVTRLIEDHQYAPKTVRQSVVLLGQLCRAAVKAGMLSEDPTEGVELPKDRRERQEVYLKHEREALCKADEGAYWGAMWVLLFHGGLRPQEALALSVRDFDGRSVSISKALKRDEKGYPRLGDPKTGTSYRRVSLSKTACEAIQQHIERYHPQEYLWETEGGRLYDVKELQKQWRRVVKKAGVRELRLYATRHTHATELLTAGHSLKAVSLRLGHASVRVTGDVYSHVIPEVDERLAEAFD